MPITLPRLRRLFGPVFVAAVFAAVLWMLRQELRQHEAREFLRALRALPAWRLAAAACCVAANYTVLVGYDLVGIRCIRRSVSWRRAALGSFLGYAIGHTLGSLLGGATIRYRLYSAWGLSALDVVKLVVVLGLTFWVGVCGLAGASLLWAPFSLPPQLGLFGTTTRPLGAVLLAAAAAYLLVCAVVRGPVRVGSWELPLPPLRIALLQLAVATLDLTLAASAVYLLLPAWLHVAYGQLVGAYVLAMVAGFTSQVPAGAGVVELVLLKTLQPAAPHQLIASLLAFRALYYLLPLLVALGVLASYEFELHRAGRRMLEAGLGEWTEMVGPRVWALVAFFAGATLLMSAALPPNAQRLAHLLERLPLAVIEAAHAAAALAGLTLLVAARGLQRRLRAAHQVSLAALALGGAASVLQGLRYEETILLLALLGVLAPSGHYFYRRWASLNERLPMGWTAAVSLLCGCAVWLALYAHAGQVNNLWARWSLADHAARPLRALAAGAVALAAYGVLVLAHRRRRRRREAAEPAQARPAARRLVEQSQRAFDWVALTGQKQLLLGPERRAVLAYAVRRSVWAALGEPIGDPVAGVETAWEFRERCDDHGALPVFFEADAELSQLFTQLGLASLPFCEEALVRLADFQEPVQLDPAVGRQLERLRADGCQTRLLQGPDAGEQLEQLAAGPDAARFAPPFPSAGPTAFVVGPRGGPGRPATGGDEPAPQLLGLVRRRDQVLAYAPIWTAGDRHEAAADCVRVRQEAGPNLLELLVTDLAAQLRAEGYAWLNLGTAPLAEPDAAVVAPVARRLARLPWRHGEHFGDPQRLRAFKAQFATHWRPKILACPGGFALPAILSNLAGLLRGEPPRRGRRLAR